MEHYTAIDPLALILRSDIYVRLTLPDPPPIEVLRENIREALKGMTPEERGRALTHVRTVINYAQTVERELAGKQATHAA